jgi:ABC-type dipeptide/oligopeptide/nickel transport system permease subunit
MASEVVEVTGRSQLFEASPQSESYLTQSLRRLLRNRGSVLGGLFLLALVVVAIFAPLIAPYDPIEIYPPEARQAPSPRHLAGTDKFGRDTMSRIIFGTRISLRVGLIGVAIALSIGGVVGLYAGYYGGRFDVIVCMLVNMMLAFPGILLALSIVAVLGPGLENVMVAVGISSIPQFLRVVRSSVLSAKENVYVEAAKIAGCSTRRIIFRHILPNVIAPVIVLSTLWVGTAILIGASVSFLGLGVQPPTPEWGVLVSEGRNYLNSMWWLSTFPGLAIVLTVLAMNLLGDGLRDALDPRLKE